LKKSLHLKTMGIIILDITKTSRNKFTQREITYQFQQLCVTFGATPLKDIKVSHVLQWQNTLTLAPKTIINYRSTLNLIFKYAYHDDLISKNPLDIIKAPKKILKDVKIFSIDEIKILINSSTSQFKNIIIVLLFQGLRGSELIALKWSKIDFTKSIITIDERIREGDTDITKSKRVRVIDMLPQTKQALINQLHFTQSYDYVFLNQYNRPYASPKTISTTLKKFCQKFNINVGTLHTLRATCNTLYKQFGLPNDWILHQIGHLEDSVNHRHYTGKIKPNFDEIGKLLSH